MDNPKAPDARNSADIPVPAAPTVSTPPTPVKPRRRRLPMYIAAALIALVILGSAGFITASALEEHDTFCIACHTVPEVTYYNRAYISLDNPTDTVTDLATAHYNLYQIHNKGSFACINCHRGDASLGHRVSTLALGGRDALIYIAGRADPNIEKEKTAEGWLPNAACVSCHADYLLTLKGQANHFHNNLPQAKQALDNGGKFIVPDSLKDRRDDLIKAGIDTINVPLTCTDCHLVHKTLPTGASTFFVETQRRNKACVSCHIIAGRGPTELQ